MYVGITVHNVCKYYSLLMTWSKAVLVILIVVEYIVSLEVVGGYHVGEALLVQQGQCVCVIAVSV